MSVPALRFKEFSSNWVEKTLGDIAIFSKGKGISKSDIDENGKTFCIRYGELYTTYGETIYDVKSKTNVNVDNLVLSEINDILIPASGETQIDIATASCVQVSGVGLGGDLNIIKSEENGIFLAYYLNSQKRLDIAKFAQGNSVVHLYASQLKLLDLKLPSLPEQTKIANFLTAVDEKITLLTQKAALLSQYKKGVMQQIFSQELRFKDDDGQEFPEWEEASIGSLFIIKAGGDIASSNVSSVKTDIYTYPIFSNSEKNLGLFGYTDEFKINTESITVTGRGTLGIAIPRYAPYYPIVRLLSLIPKLTFNVYFGASAINMLNVFIESTGVPQLTAPQISDYVISFPSLPEQNKIANFLTAIDEKITNNQTQLDAVKQYKHGLLQQMFV